MPDLRCYFVTGAGTPAEIVRIAAAAARGGAGVVQVRSKPISARDLFFLGRDVARAVAKANPETRVLIDDRVDVAAALRHAGEPVHGVHVGQDDLPVAAARALLGPDAIIGLTTGTRELVESANDVADVIDYIGCGPFRATPTKDSGRTPLGLHAYPELVKLSRVPLVAIGDVTVEDAADLAATGVAGLAVVRGIMNAEDPEVYCRDLLSGFDEGAR
ncbi:thiamine phosphate synthase [Corynebacterium aurimucosum]